MRKLVFYANVLALIIIHACYLNNDMLGQQSEVFLGLFQLLNAVSLTVYTLIYKEKIIGIHLKIYWLLIALFVILFQTAINAYHNTAIAILFIYPLFIAFYFTYITYLFFKKQIS